MIKKSPFFLMIFSFILLLFLDRFSKMMAVKKLGNGNVFSVIPEVLEFHYLENRGAAFGLLQNQQFFFLFSSIIILILIGYVFYKLPNTRRYTPLYMTLTLLTAGTLGNMYDRICYNYVIDFIYFKLIDFPIFNVADIYVVISCILFVYFLFFYYKESELACIFGNKK